MKLGKVVSRFTGTAAAPASSPAPRMQRLAGGLRLGGVLGQLGGGGQPMEVFEIPPGPDGMIRPLSLNTPTLVVAMIGGPGAFALVGDPQDPDMLIQSWIDGETSRAIIVDSDTTIAGLCDPGSFATFYYQEVPE